MKSFFHRYLWLICLTMGIFAGMCISPFNHSRQSASQKDTVVVYDTARYSRLELETKRHRLNVPDITAPSIVMVQEDSTTIIYRDSVRYVTLPREYFYTNVDDVEIWHSGIDSRIDSLAVRRREMMITTREKPKKNALGIGIEASYYSGLYIPAYIEYERMMKPWFSVYGRVGYNFPTLEYGVSLGVRMQLKW